MSEHMFKSLFVIILAAGKGTRMKSALAKVLHPICGKPMLAYPIRLAKIIGAEKIVVVTGHQASLVMETFKDQGLIFVEQREQLGTGHAVLQVRDVLGDDNGIALILCGDVPFLRPATVNAFIEHHMRSHSSVSVMTTVLENPFGYGRIVKKGDTGELLKIVEERDATSEEKKIREVNTGIYCADLKFLFEVVAEVKNDNAQGEYYLTDIIELSRKKGKKNGTFTVTDPVEVMGINTLNDLERASRLAGEMWDEDW